MTHGYGPLKGGVWVGIGISWMASIFTSWGADPAGRRVAAETGIEKGSPPIVAEETGVRLGTNRVEAGRVMVFKAPLSPYAKAQMAGLGTNVTLATGALVLPEGWSERSQLPLLVVCSPSGSPSIPQLSSYTNAALPAGWALLAADGPPLPAARDTVLWNWGLVGSALGYLERSLPQARNWPVAVGGFSGGAKRAACVAAAMAQARRRVLGVFMGGCNEDRATTGALLFGAGPAFPETPIFLSNGSEDPIAGPAHGAAVKGAMERNGFHRVRLEVYQGGHRLASPHVRQALDWFQENAASSPPGPRSRP